MTSKKIFNLAISTFFSIMSLLLYGYVMTPESNSSFHWVFWIAFAAMIVFGVLTICFQIKEHIKSSTEERSLLNLIANVLAIAGFIVLNIIAIYNFYGVFIVWFGGGYFVSKFLIPATGLIGVAGILKIINLFINKTKARKENKSVRNIISAQSLPISIMTFIALYCGFVFCSFYIPSDKVSIPIGVTLFFLCAEAAILFAAFAAVSKAKALFRNDDERYSKLSVLSQLIFTVGVLTVELGFIWFALSLFTAYFKFDYLLIFSIASIVLFAAALIIKLIDVLKNNRMEKSEMKKENEN